jgi:probable HAF family extracellular repeat protein
MRNIWSAVLLGAAIGCGKQEQVTQPRQERAEAVAVRYTITKLPSLGGTQSRGMAISRQGWVAGWSNQADGTRRAVIWKNGVISNLQTLGGPSSTVPWPGLNDDGTVVGISHTNETDPLEEDWACELGGFLPGGLTDLICRGFAWERGMLWELPTVGGHHSFGTGKRMGGRAVSRL